jgi:hypothetical protein
MRKELQTYLHVVVSNTPVTHVGVHVQQTQIQSNLVTNPIPVNQHVSWPQTITPLIARQPKTIPYTMRYNIVATPLWAKCEGEPTLPKVGIWSPPRLPNTQSSSSGFKTPRIGVFLVSLKIS